jgi:hypothetical protein
MHLNFNIVLLAVLKVQISYRFTSSQAGRCGVVVAHNRGSGKWFNFGFACCCLASPRSTAEKITSRKS